MADLSIRFTTGTETHNPGNVEVGNERLGEIVTMAAFTTTKISTYKWELLDKPEGSASVIDAPLSHAPHFTPDYDGTYLTRLTANEGMSGERISIAYIGYYMYLLDSRIPAAGETTEEGRRGWADEVGFILRKTVNMSGRGTTLLCSNACGAILNPGDAVMLSAQPDGKIKPYAVKASREMLAAADPDLAFIGIVLGDPVYRRAVADGEEVVAAFGPGAASGLNIGGEVPESYPAPVTLGEEAGTLAYGSTPTVAYAYNSGVAILMPPRMAASQESVLILTDDKLLSADDIGKDRFIIADAEALSLVGRTLEIELPAVPPFGFARAHIAARNGQVRTTAAGEATIAGETELTLNDRESVDLLYYDGDWLPTGGIMKTVRIDSESLSAISAAIEPCANAMQQAAKSIMQLNLMLSLETGMNLPEIDDIADDKI